MAGELEAQGWYAAAEEEPQEAFAGGGGAGGAGGAGPVGYGGAAGYAAQQANPAPEPGQASGFDAGESMAGSVDEPAAPPPVQPAARKRISTAATSVLRGESTADEQKSIYQQLLERELRGALTPSRSWRTEDKWQPGSVVTETPQRPSGERVAAYQEAQDNRMIQEGYQVEREAAAASVGVQQEAKALREQEAALEADRAADMDRQRSLQAAFAERQQSLDDIEAGKIDPQRYFKRPGPVIGAIAGVILGMAGAPQLLQWVMAQQQHDIDAQTAEYERLKAVGKERASVLGELVQMHGDERAALADYRERWMAGINGKVKNMVAEAGTPTAEERYKLWSTQAQEIVQKDRMAVETAMSQSSRATKQFVPGRSGGGGINTKRALGLAKELADSTGTAPLTGEVKERQLGRKLFVQGMDGEKDEVLWTNSPTKGMDQTDVMGAQVDAVTAIDDLVNIAEKGGASLSLEARGRVLTNYTLLTQLAAKASGKTDALTGTEADDFKAIAGAQVADVASSNRKNVAALKRLRSLIMTTRHRIKKELAVDPDYTQMWGRESSGLDVRSEE